MQLEVKIDAAAVEKQISEAVINSALGKHIEEAINKMLVSPGYSRRSPLEDAVYQELSAIIARCVHDELDKRHAEVAAKIAACITPEILETMTEKLWKAVSNA